MLGKEIKKFKNKINNKSENSVNSISLFSNILSINNFAKSSLPI